jgi:hypothetical protein
MESNIKRFLNLDLTSSASAFKNDWSKTIPVKEKRLKSNDSIFCIFTAHIKAEKYLCLPSFTSVKFPGINSSSTKEAGVVKGFIVVAAVVVGGVATTVVVVSDAVTAVVVGDVVAASLVVSAGNEAGVAGEADS